MPSCDGDDGCRRRNKRRRGSGDCTGSNDSGDNERINHRCSVAAADYMDGDDDMDGGLYVDEDADYYDYGEEGGSASIYYDSDDEKNFDEQTVEAEKTQVIEPKKERYRVLTEDDVRERQEADTAEVTDVLSIPPGIAAILLRHFKWRAIDIQGKWFSDEHRRICDTVGLPPDDGVPTVATNDDTESEFVCGICFDDFPNREMRSAACATHLYCRACWRGYIAAAVQDGARCLSLRCPDTSCLAPVARELVDAAAGEAERARYASFAVRSYVEDSGGRIKWCPGPGCACAVEFLGCSSDAPDVSCDCKHVFCFRCGEEAHRPVTCETVRAWTTKNASDSENANWVLAHTKHCPKCRKPIEKNQCCNHIHCRCGHHFCWLCLQPAGNTGRGIHYACGIDTKVPVSCSPETKEEHKRRQAKASLDRYLYHYERWAANLASLNMALKDMDKLQESGLTEMAAAVGCEEMELEFLKKAYEQVADCRRVLRWSHAYGYFLDPERDYMKRELFDHLLNDANNALERLHGCAELERKELIDAPSSSGDGADVVTKKIMFDTYKQKLNNLIRVTRHYFENLVKAFETDLPEISAVNFTTAT